MSAVIFVAVILALTVPLAWLARRRLIAEPKLMWLRGMFWLRRDMEQMAEQVGRALLPSVRSMAAAFADFARAMDKPRGGS